MRHRSTRRLLAAIALAGVLTLVGGCLYRMEIKQGNFLDPTQVVQLQNGMTKSQVKFLLGTPMVPNGFDSDRWNYYYYVKNRYLGKPITKRLTVWFKEDKVDHFERPDDSEAAAARMAEDNAKAAAEAAAATNAPVAPPPRIRSNPASTTPTPQPRR